MFLDEPITTFSKMSDKNNCGFMKYLSSVLAPALVCNYHGLPAGRVLTREKNGRINEQIRIEGRNLL